ncbi:TerC family protein [Terribacillus saccharophilus]|uniref:TerC family protein n=1 Tax=Terribacillus saccharophilus TaxID=361277 RepID=UPI003981EFB0
MDSTLWIEYGWILLVLIGLEGLLAADNALVMALIVKHLPADQQRKALLYGLGGAFIFRFASLFFVSFLVNIWQIQALGALYLLYICIANLIKLKKNGGGEDAESPFSKKNSGFWMTVLKVELADIAFAVDSILTAVALAASLSATPLPHIGGMDGGQFLVVLAGGMIGLILIRIAASYIVKILDKRPGLEAAAYLIIGWVAIKLAIHTLAHPALEIIPEHFPDSAGWNATFWIVMAVIAIGGWFYKPKSERV